MTTQQNLTLQSFVNNKLFEIAKRFTDPSSFPSSIGFIGGKLFGFRENILFCYDTGETSLDGFTLPKPVGGLSNLSSLIKESENFKDFQEAIQQSSSLVPQEYSAIIELPIEVANIIKRVGVFTEKDIHSGRSDLRCVRLEVEPNNIHFVATDGIMLSQQILFGEYGFDTSFGFCLPYFTRTEKTIIDLLIKTQPEKFIIQFIDGENEKIPAYIGWDNFSFYYLLPSEKGFPHYQRVIPAIVEKSVIVNRTELINLLSDLIKYKDIVELVFKLDERLYYTNIESRFKDMEINGQITVESFDTKVILKDNVVLLMSRRVEEERFPEGFDFAVDVNRMLTCLKTFNTDKVRVGYNTDINSKMIVFEAAGNDLITQKIQKRQKSKEETTPIMTNEGMIVKFGNKELLVKF